MISFVQLPYRGEKQSHEREFGPAATALILALIVCFQLVLLAWVFLKGWRS
jgi:hypothetical protein